MPWDPQRRPSSERLPAFPASAPLTVRRALAVVGRGRPARPPGRRRAPGLAVEELPARVDDLLPKRLEETRSIATRGSTAAAPRDHPDGDRRSHLGHCRALSLAPPVWPALDAAGTSRPPTRGIARRVGPSKATSKRNARAKRRIIRISTAGAKLVRGLLWWRSCGSPSPSHRRPSPRAARLRPSFL